MVLLLCLLMPAVGFTQVFGGNPSRTPWRFLATPKATIIFPSGSDSSARRIAGIMDRINALTDSSIGTLRRPVQVVLQPATTISNGYVSLAPFRSEFFLTPPTNPFELGNLNWVDQLALHEYRHVQQYSNYNRGLTKVFSVVLGEQGQALANTLTIPDWFFEGDAVFQETLLSTAGRGRMAAFFNGYRAIWEAGIDYSFMKLRNGSLRHYVPDHYELGYQMIAFGQDKFGPEFWKKVSLDAASMKGLFYPFQKAVRRYSGFNYREFIRQAGTFNKLNLLSSMTIPEKKPPLVEHRENPVFTEHGNLLYLKSSYSRTPVFMELQQGQEKKMRVSDRLIDHYFGYANNTIVYASFRPDTRWGWVDYSELQLLDLLTGKQKRISKKSRFFTPSLSPAGDSVLAVHIPVIGSQAIVLLDKNGQQLKQFQHDSSYMFFHPVFWKDKILVAVKNAASMMTLMSVNLQTGSYNQLLPWSATSLGYPRGIGDTVVFTKTVQGRDRVMMFLPKAGQSYLLENIDEVSVAGQYQPAVLGDTLAYVQFTAGGLTIKLKSFSSMNFQPCCKTVSDTGINFGVRSLYSARNNFLAHEGNAGGSIENYRKSRKFFNFHSWQPYYEDPEFSFSVYGQNILNTFQSQVFALYNRNEGFTQLGFSGLFGGFYPFLKGTSKFTLNRRGIFEQRTIYWNQLQSSVGFSIPLNLSRGRSLTYLTTGTDLVLTRDYFREPEQQKLGQTPYLYLDHDIRFSHQSLQARQEFNPRFAQTLHLNFRYTVNKYESRQFLESLNLYFPGLSRNHSLVFNLAGQQRDSSHGIMFSNSFPFVRGYAAENFFRMVKSGINYQLPLFYPDAGAWNIVYLLRVRTNFYFDIARVKDPALAAGNKYTYFRSFGNELFFDTKWWNQLPLSIGIRYARLLDDDPFGGSGKNRWQIILPVNLVPGGVNARKYQVF